MSGILPFRLSIKARLRCQQHIRQAQSLAEKPLPSICTFLGSPEKYFFDKYTAEDFSRRMLLLFQRYYTQP